MYLIYEKLNLPDESGHFSIRILGNEIQKPVVIKATISEVKLLLTNMEALRKSELVK